MPTYTRRRARRHSQPTRRRRTWTARQTPSAYARAPRQTNDYETPPAPPDTLTGCCRPAPATPKCDANAIAPAVARHTHTHTLCK